MLFRPLAPKAARNLSACHVCPAPPVHHFFLSISLPYFARWVCPSSIRHFLFCFVVIVLTLSVSLIYWSSCFPGVTCRILRGVGFTTLQAFSRDPDRTVRCGPIIYVRLYVLLAPWSRSRCCCLSKAGRNRSDTQCPRLDTGYPSQSMAGRNPNVVVCFSQKKTHTCPSRAGRNPTTTAFFLFGVVFAILAPP